MESRGSSFPGEWEPFQEWKEGWAQPLAEGAPGSTLKTGDKFSGRRGSLISSPAGCRNSSHVPGSPAGFRSRSFHWPEAAASRFTEFKFLSYKDIRLKLKGVFFRHTSVVRVAFRNCKFWVKQARYYGRWAAAVFLNIVLQFWLKYRNNSDEPKERATSWMLEVPTSRTHSCTIPWWKPGDPQRREDTQPPSPEGHPELKNLSIRIKSDVWLRIELGDATHEKHVQGVLCSLLWKRKFV